MKRPSLRQFLAIAALGLLVAIGTGVYFLGSAWGQRKLTRMVRERIARNSDLVLAPFEVEFSWLHDFPHITASLRHFSLTDTAFHQAVPVLRIGRADVRLQALPLLRGRVEFDHLTLHDVDFQQLTDSLGHNWSLHGKGPHRKAAYAPPDFLLNSLRIHNLRVTDRNDLQHSGFSAFVQEGQLAVQGRGGVGHVRGTLQGQLQYLRSGRGNLFEQEPITAWVRYQYDFRQRQGTFQRTRATLNGDTVLINGTHQAAGPDQPPGTTLNLHFRGKQPLVEVLHVALPTSLHRYLSGAVSSSRARIDYTIRGLSGPLTRPRTVLRFDLRNAQMRWPGSARQIRRWDARGVFDNGPEHSATSTYLAFEQCRLFSTAGELQATVRVTNFTQPVLTGHVQGRTELQTLATVVAPDLWHARAGQAALNIDLNGLLPEIPERAARQAGHATILPPLAVRGTITLQNASFTVPHRRADMSGLNVRVRLRDSLWQLENLTGQLNGMHVRANATTTYLLAYFTGQHPTTTITGSFVADELYLSRVRQLLAPPTRAAGSPLVRARPKKSAPRQEIATRALNLFPPGMRLNIGLQCQRLVLRSDTLRHLTARIRHDGQQVQLSNLQMRVWDGLVQGAVSWPTDTLQDQPVAARLAVTFNTLSYRRFLALLARPPRRKVPTQAPDASLQDMVLNANGQVEATIHKVVLPAGENLTNLRLRLNKTGPTFKVPYLTFGTSAGGTGRVSASAQLNGAELQGAQADIRLRYQTLDIQRLFQLLAALTPPAKKAPTASTKAATGMSPLLDGTVTARVEVTAEHIVYSMLRGSDFRLRSRLAEGWATLEQCSLQTCGGTMALRGKVQMDAEQGARHPLHAQVRLQEIDLSELFGLAAALRFDVLGPENIRGSMHCEGDLHTTLDATFLPLLAQTHAYLKTDLRNLELLDVTALQEALKFLREKRTSHLYFEPVSPQFVLDGNRVLIPSLPLNSNLTDLAISGEYHLDGRANLYVGLSPMQTLFGNNEKRIERIKSGEAAHQRSRGLVYLSLRRTPGSKYKVGLFKKQDQRQQQIRLRQEFQRLLLKQPLDTTLRLLQ
ncbi:AsmA-like C-terminal region-containing protein [Hymenobacter fodinae]|uniref:Uncharacterized protein n=1 Tax=Hymenobacter fodinae TaxID=2510796 RepID=A0A4Z0P913_9BACT|nr:AsmA-like C-terminal region-containing protein [Hymenobacter fodinae]TGE08649.1 hypothetical protein EU556_13205 [Hymenobacter fodinae]